MKTDNQGIYMLIAIVLLLWISLVLLSGCQKAEDDNPQPISIMGKWEPVDYSIINEMNGTSEVLGIEIFLDFYSSTEVSEVYTVGGDTYGVDTTTFIRSNDSLYTTYLEGKYTLTDSTLSTKKVVDKNEEGEERYVQTIFKRLDL